MAIITFTSKESKETGQTMSIAALATAMAIEHNYKILVVSTAFQDNSLENCFWNDQISKKKLGVFGTKIAGQDIANGTEGLIRTFASNRASADMIRNYTRVVFKDRLDIMQSLKTIDYREYIGNGRYFSQIIELANTTYDIVLVDLNRALDRETKEKILMMSQLVVVNLTQTMHSIDNFNKVKQEQSFYNQNNVVLLLGRYDQDSKYSDKNIARYLREKKYPCKVPYNIQFVEACSEGQLVEYITKIRNVPITDKNGYFFNILKNTNEELIYKLQEQRMGM